MDFIYRFVIDPQTGWEDQFHKSYFLSTGFIYGLAIAAILGALLCLGFYFGCCNNSRSVKMANINVWAAFLIITGIAAYFTADIALIGNPDDQNPPTTSFVAANKAFLRNHSANAPQTTVNELNRVHQKINTDLRQGKDVAMAFDLTTAILAMLFFLGFSLIIKRFTLTGKAIPCLKP